MLDFLMNWINMSLQAFLSCSFIFTLITRILDFLMDGFNMSLHFSLISKLFSTLITRKLELLMNCFNMRLQATLSFKLRLALITGFFNFFMNWFNESSDFSYEQILCHIECKDILLSQGLLLKMLTKFFAVHFPELSFVFVTWWWKHFLP